ncbi:MAG: deoxyribose-phosphate aldolase [Candidatus Latescibacteria bacterium]|nr:deoxyribose-phosphate aldolase [Candidatus Latescibacterota bacterium]
MKLNKYIDHTILKPEASERDVRKLCAEAKEYDFATVFVNPYYVPLAKRLLKKTDVKVGCAIGFPLGATTTEVKVLETLQAIKNGADEIDMVINIGAVKSKKFAFVKNDIKSVVKAAAPKGVKVILETCLLTDAEKVKVARIAKQAGVKFVKTSTGFSSGGATVEDIKLLRKTVGKKLGVKASGGIRDYKTTIAMIEAGANRIGTSAGVKIMELAELEKLQGKFNY